MKIIYSPSESRLHPHVAHPVHLRIRKHRGEMSRIALLNDWAATHLAILFGIAWTIWVFFIVPLVAYFLPAAIQAHIFFFSSGWVQLFALPLMIYVGNKLQRSSDAQSEVMHEALTHIAVIGDQNKKLLEQNTELTQQVHEILRKQSLPVGSLDSPGTAPGRNCSSSIEAPSPARSGENDQLQGNDACLPHQDRVPRGL